MTRIPARCWRASCWSPPSSAVRARPPRPPTSPRRRSPSGWRIQARGDRTRHPRRHRHPGIRWRRGAAHHPGARRQPARVRPDPRLLPGNAAGAIVHEASPRRAHGTPRLLGRISDRYGVPGRVVVAIWGIESNFGRFTGVRPTVATLATLAFDGRRGPFFRGQLLDALTIVDRGDVELARLRGSWAGAMGQPQFMPSSYLKYAQDFDEDGRRDIWTSQADVFASIANYLAQHGWTRDLRWGREVQLPASAGRLDGVDLRPTGCRAEREMSEPRSWNAWRGLGLTRVDGASLPHSDLTASLVRSGSRAFLVSANYESLLAYNCAHHYALAVALLAEQV